MPLPAFTHSIGHPPQALVFLGAITLSLGLLHLARRSFLLAALMSLPGTFAHELCHWSVGLLMNGKPRSFTVLPRRQGRGIVLGSVGFAHLRWFNAPFIGLAPLLLLPGAYGLFRWKLQATPAFGWPQAGLAFLVANLLIAALPSGQDLRIAARSPLGWVMLAAALGWGWVRFRAGASRPPQSWKLTRTENSRPAPGRGGLPPEPGIP